MRLSLLTGLLLVMSQKNYQFFLIILKILLVIILIQLIKLMEQVFVQPGSTQIKLLVDHVRMSFLIVKLVLSTHMVLSLSVVHLVLLAILLKT